MSDGSRDIKLLTLINSGATFNFMNSPAVKHLGWAIKYNSTLFEVILDNGIVVHSSSATSGLVSSGVWKAYLILLVLDVSFKAILGMP